MNPSANITFGGIEDAGLTVKVKDSTNPKMKWQVWKQDRENKELENEAYTAIKKLELGEVFGVIYSEKDESFIGKEGTTVTYKKRTIYEVLPPVSNPTTQTTKRPLYDAPVNAQSQSKDNDKSDKFWDMQGFKKCLWNYFIEVKKGVPLTPGDYDVCWSQFKENEAQAKARFFVFSASATPNELKVEDPLPIIDSETSAESNFGDGTPIPNEISVEDIPF